MKNKERFDEFLNCCKTEQIKHIYLTDVSLIANRLSADFGSVIFEFGEKSFILKSRPWSGTEEESNEFQIDRIGSITKLDLNIYKTISFDKDGIVFVSELTDENGYFDGLELKTDGLFFFILASEHEVTVTVSKSDYLKYELYPHLFGYCACLPDDDLTVFFEE